MAAWAPESRAPASTVPDLQQEPAQPEPEPEQEPEQAREPVWWALALVPPVLT